MHELANEIIEKRIDEFVDEWDFNTRRKIHPEECVCYRQNKKCHNIEELNCLFCYCPNYIRTIKEGACKIESPKGKYIDNHEGKIWDCSDCDFPHTKENAIKFLNELFD
jgi:Zn-finger protein